MKQLTIFQWLLLLPAFLLLLVCLGLCALVLMYAPPAVTVAALGLFAVVLVWFFLTRRRGTSSASEHSMLRQSSKEGLL